MAAAVKMQETKAHTAFIPKDIMANIFKRLPVRSLYRFQCVCRDWKDLIKYLIKTPPFVQDHFHYSNCQDPVLLLEQYHPKFCGIRLSVLDCDMRVGKVQNLPSIHSLYNSEVLGSSNGLVCVKTENGINPHPILIWNPATRDIREVRTRTIIHFDLIDGLGFEYYRTYIEPKLVDYFGFGFSPLDSDYKIVRINLFHPSTIKAVDLYSLNCGSWKQIDFGNLNGIKMSSAYITINGVMFWDTAWWDDNKDLVLSIDLSKEVCKLIRMPYLGYASHRNLVEYENKLALVARKGGSNLIHLWVLKKYTCPSEDSEEEKRWKWTKIYTSSPCPCPYLIPRTIWRNEIVLVPDQIENDGQTTIILYLLNLTTNEFKRHAVISSPHNFQQIRKGTKRDDVEIDIFNYIESLVLVNRHH
ncbi:F-box protein CPR1-like [Neltuma alba]|uniref:F-box protein CPR1-like n=1 Tax=Neltuma alba TaxID=207710 RepID=UPI0010A5606F|nr:F-box protein CPR1-like [Prosopis alba]